MSTPTSTPASTPFSSPAKSHATSPVKSQATGILPLFDVDAEKLAKHANELADGIRENNEEKSSATGQAFIAEVVATRGISMSASLTTNLMELQKVATVTVVLTLINSILDCLLVEQFQPIPVLADKCFARLFLYTLETLRAFIVDWQQSGDAMSDEERLRVYHEFRHMFERFSSFHRWRDLVTVRFMGVTNGFAYIIVNFNNNAMPWNADYDLCKLHGVSVVFMVAQASDLSVTCNSWMLSVGSKHASVFVENAEFDVSNFDPRQHNYMHVENNVFHVKPTVPVDSAMSTAFGTKKVTQVVPVQAGTRVAFVRNGNVLILATATKVWLSSAQSLPPNIKSVLTYLFERAQNTFQLGNVISDGNTHYVRLEGFEHSQMRHNITKFARLNICDELTFSEITLVGRGSFTSDHPTHHYQTTRASTPSTPTTPNRSPPATPNRSPPATPRTPATSRTPRTYIVRTPDDYSVLVATNLQGLRTFMQLAMRQRPSSSSPPLRALVSRVGEFFQTQVVTFECFRIMNNIFVDHFDELINHITSQDSAFVMSSFVFNTVSLFSNLSMCDNNNFEACLRSYPTSLRMHVFLSFSHLSNLQ